MQLLTIVSIALGNTLMASAQGACTTNFYSETKCGGNLITSVDTPCSYMGQTCHNVSTSSRVQSFDTNIPETDAQVMFFSEPDCKGTIVADAITGCVSLNSTETVLSFFVSL